MSVDSAGWSADRLHQLSLLDTYSAHLASCATRLATIHEILVGGTEEAWAIAYPNDDALNESSLSSTISHAIEILLRDNVAHAEDPAIKGKKRSKVRKAAVGRLTFKEMQDQLRLRYQALADKMRAQ